MFFRDGLQRKLMRKISRMTRASGTSLSLNYTAWSMHSWRREVQGPRICTKAIASSIALHALIRKFCPHALQCLRTVAAQHEHGIENALPALCFSFARSSSVHVKSRPFVFFLASAWLSIQAVASMFDDEFTCLCHAAAIFELYSLVMSGLWTLCSAYQVLEYKASTCRVAAA